MIQIMDMMIHEWTVIGSWMISDDDGRQLMIIDYNGYEYTPVFSTGARI